MRKQDPTTSTMAMVAPFCCIGFTKRSVNVYPNDLFYFVLRVMMLEYKSDEKGKDIRQIICTSKRDGFVATSNVRYIQAKDLF